MKFIQFFTGFFQESDGSSSMMRGCFFISTIGLIGLSFYIQSSKGGWNAYNASMVASSFGLVFGAKAWQKKQEAKLEIQEKLIQGEKEIQQGITETAKESAK